MKKNYLILILLFSAFGMSMNALKAQTPFNPNTYSGWVSTPTNSFATVPAGTGVVFTQITRGAGNTFSTAADGINSSKWNNPSANAAIAANQYLTFSVSANSATTFEIDSLSLILGRSNAGPDSCILQYKSAATGNNFTSVVSGVRVILNPSSSPTTVLSIIPPAPISGDVNDTIVFRLVAWHASSTLGTMKLINNSAVYGKTMAVTTNSISAAVVQPNTPACVSSLLGDSLQVTFNSIGVFNAGNNYSLELSDASGSFSAPLVLGTLNSSLNTGIINGFIPAGTSSVNYLLRIKSSDPAIDGLDTTHLMVYPGMILNASLIQPNCPDSTGEIDLTVTGGSGAIQYSWSNSQSTQDLTNLTGGTYTVNITDAAACSADSSFNIQSIPAFLVSDSIADVTCNSGTTGAVHLTVNGATSPYIISWSGNGISQTGPVANSLSSGIYSVSILDANNCPYTNTYTVNEPDVISVTDSIVTVVCSSESTGGIHVSVNGGTAPYSISWTGNGINQAGTVASNLPAGTYDLTILDANNCPYNNQYSVTEPTPVSISASIVHAVCSSCTGTITLSTNGGVAPYSFQWENNSTSQVLIAVPGEYCVEILDANACGLDTCFTISSTAGMEDESTHSLTRVFPNPASDAFQILFSDQLHGIKKEVLVLNSLGEIVFKETIDSDLQQLNMKTDQWSNGTYSYQILTTSGMFETGKISILK